MRRLLLFFTVLLFQFAVATPLKAQPQEAQVGFYLMNLYGLNMDEHSFYADFYVWFKWRGDIDPTNIEFVNTIEKWSMASAGFDGDSTPVVLKMERNTRFFAKKAAFFMLFRSTNFRWISIRWISRLKIRSILPANSFTSRTPMRRSSEIRSIWSAGRIVTVN